MLPVLQLHLIFPVAIFLLRKTTRSIFRLISSILRESGAKVTEVKNGKEAVDQLSQSAFDLIIMDLHMPVMDGREATRVIRSMESDRKQTPILALTADVIPEHRELAFDAGIDEYLVKPIDELQMWSIIHKLLGSKSRVEPRSSLLLLQPQRISRSRPEISKRHCRLPAAGVSWWKNSLTGL